MRQLADDRLDSFPRRKKGKGKSSQRWTFAVCGGLSPSKMVQFAFILAGVTTRGQQRASWDGSFVSKMERLHIPDRFFSRDVRGVGGGTHWVS